MKVPEPAPLRDDELSALPVFPLPNAVLLPASAMALHLFEPRYRALARHCLAGAGHAMAIARLLPGYEADYQGRPAIAKIAGAGRIVAHHARPDGTFDILLVGIGRVVLEEHAQPHDFRVAEARIVDRDDGSAELRAQLASLLSLVSRLPAPPQPLPIPPAELEGSPGRQLDVLADRYFPTNDGGVRLSLLEATSPLERARLLHEVLASQVMARARPSGALN